MGQIQSLRRAIVAALVGVAVVPASLCLLLCAVPGASSVGLIALSSLGLASVVAVFGWRVLRSRLGDLGAAFDDALRMSQGLRADLEQRDQSLTSGHVDISGRQSALRSFQADIAARIETVQASSVTLHKTADELSRAALRITSETTTVAVVAEDANRKVAAIAVAGQDFFATISRIGEHAARSARMGTEAVRDTESTSTTIGELTATSDQIGAMTELIAGIARQTNLLALNATIEAARAGEQGRGFAVVAAEVKALATETAKAVATIAQMATSIRTSTERSVAAMTAVGASIGGLNIATADIADAVEERVQAAASMAESVDDAASNVRYVTSAIGKIEAVVDETMQGAGFLRATAADIADHAEAIRAEVEAYIARAATTPRAPSLNDRRLNDRTATGGKP